MKHDIIITGCTYTLKDDKKHKPYVGLRLIRRACRKAPLVVFLSKNLEDVTSKVDNYMLKEMTIGNVMFDLSKK